MTKRAGFSGSGEKGNALFLILIAVALFAALSYAITQSGRGSGNVHAEQREINISHLYQYAGTLQQAVQRMRLLSGCTDAMLDFQSTRFATAADYVNDEGDPPADGTCRVFEAQGGGVTWQAPPAAFGVAEYGIYGSHRVVGIGNTNTPDLIVFAQVDREACIRINEREGISNPGGEPPNYKQIVAVPDLGLGFAFDGDYTTNNHIGASAGATDVDLVGRASGCLYSSFVIQKYFFYFVLLER